MGLEGKGSKRRHSAYQSGRCAAWNKATLAELINGR